MASRAIGRSALRKWLAVVLLAAAVVSGCSGGAVKGADDVNEKDEPKVQSFRLLEADRGGRVDWHPADETLVAFDHWGSDGFHDVYTMRIDGSEKRCLTCDVAPDVSGWQPRLRIALIEFDRPID